jgi:hypothetical protein
VSKAEKLCGSWLDPTFRDPELVLIGDVSDLQVSVKAKNLQRPLVILDGEYRISMVEVLGKSIRFPVRVLPSDSMSARWLKIAIERWGGNYPLYDKMHSRKKASPWFAQGQSILFSPSFSHSRSIMSWPSVVRGALLASSYSPRGGISNSSASCREVLSAWKTPSVAVTLFVPLAREWEEEVCSFAWENRGATAPRTPAGIAFGLLAYRRLHGKLGGQTWATLRSALGGSSRIRTPIQRIGGDLHTKLFSAYNRQVNAHLPRGVRLNLK